MCDGCSYWHGDYRLDILGRSIEKLERDIERQEFIIRNREGYGSSREGYGIRTREMMRNVEIDRQWLAEVQTHIAEHSKDAAQIGKRGSRSGVSQVKNGRGNRGR